MHPKEIKIEDYRYDLPPDRIAQFPLDLRDESKLLMFRNEEISQTRFSNLPDLLPQDSLIVWNNTKVIPARLVFQKPTGAIIEVFLLEPLFPSSYPEMFEQKSTCEWKVIIGNQKKWKGEPLTRKTDNNGVIVLSAESKGDDKNIVSFKWSDMDLTFAQVLEIFGKTPIPPYLKRDSEEKDKTRYQTVYANLNGSVAAPTAGLHFTQDLINLLLLKNIRFKSITLHVGSGTFVPVKADKIADHQMHSETVIIEKNTINELLGYPTDRLTVVGTTSLRSLESLYWLGHKIFLNPDIEPVDLFVDQWQPYKSKEKISTRDSLLSVLNYLESKKLNQIEFTTTLIIVPGYSFKIVNRLITNFHQPASTLLLLVSALIGDKWKEIYHYALSNDFRFLSYGDSSLLERKSL
jgi:S-adenosylmethionine:tRNA ribosyltransferase-isomerase